jgi:secondary thiamine-phosphate synthase enzyme
VKGTSYTLEIQSTKRDQMIDITSKVREIVRLSTLSSGLCLVFVPHTTAGVTINENTDPDVTGDMLRQLDKMIPWNGEYSHIEGNSAAHLKASMMGSSVTIIIDGHELLLGTWQGIYFCEFDGPRDRKVIVKVMG